MAPRPISEFVDGQKIAHFFLHSLWSFVHLILSIWHQALNLFNVLESHIISSGLLKKYSTLDVSKLNYLAIVVDSEDAHDTSKIIELLDWLVDIGVKHVCLYDMEGVLKKLQDVITENCGTKSWQLAETSERLIDANQRTLEFASFSDGKEAVVKAANLLSLKYLKLKEQGKDHELLEFTEKLLDDALKTIGCRGPDPDLLLVYGPARCHLGFPAWRMRYTEIVLMRNLLLFYLSDSQAYGAIEILELRFAAQGHLQVYRSSSEFRYVKVGCYRYSQEVTRLCFFVPLS